MLRLMTARHLSYCALCAGAYRWVPRLGFGLELIGPVECVLRAPKPDRVRDVGSEVRPSTSCGHRSQAECVLRALKPGRVRDVAPESGWVLDVPGLECIVVRSLRSKLIESQIA